jgi:anaerobic magnesium-protoporphyrin IX monomethyl ester cyclase
MKVQLIFAPAILYSSLEVMAERMWPPLSILYIGGYLRAKYPDINLKLTDGCHIGYDKTLLEINEFNPDIVGISFLTTTSAGAMKLSRHIKKVFLDTTVVMGGVHATALPEEVLKESNADFVVIGEGEEPFYQIVRAIKEKANPLVFHNITGVWSLGSNGQVYKNPPTQFIDPLDSIPFPAWDLINLKAYKGYFLSKQTPEAPQFWARGCPFSCTFCSNAVWKSSKPHLRLRSPENIADELEYLRNEFGIREVFDQADEFNNSLEHALKVCRELKRRNLGISWKAQMRAKPITDELAREMAEAGCWYVHLGIESGNEQTLRGVKKFITLKDVDNACRLLKKYGIKIRALFMIYNVWEENGQLRFEDSQMSINTLKYAKNLIDNKLADYVSWTAAAPYPGSVLYDIALKYNLIKPEFKGNLEAWQKEDLFMMNLPGISRGEQRLVKLRGDWFKMIQMLKNMDFKLKDMPFILKRAIHTIRRS